MRFGFHISISGGFKNVVPRAKELGCDTIQVFSRNPRAWKYKPLDKEDIALFKQSMKTANISPLFVHMPYLVNLASSNSNLFKLSVDSLITDLKRSAIIGAQYLILHAGSSRNMERGIQKMIIGINKAFSKARNDVVLTLENTPGSGNEFGYNFSQIRKIMNGIDDNIRIGMVLDTAHAFAAGYDLRTKKGVNKTLCELTTVIGLENLHLVHLNDSKTECGSRRDRHWHIGKGIISNGMQYILNDPLLSDKPFIMETPRTNIEDDLMNLRAARKYLRKQK